MAVPEGKPAPSLSSLQAQLRKGNAAPTEAQPQRTEEGASSGQQKRSLNSEGGSPTPPLKKRAAVRVVKVPGVAATSMPPGGAPPPKVQNGSPPTVAAASATAVASPTAPAPSAAAPPTAVALSAEDSAPIKKMLAAIEAAPAAAKTRHLSLLAEAVGQNLPIEHINHFLIALKKKIVERARSDGVPVKEVPSQAAVKSGQVQLVKVKPGQPPIVKTAQAPVTKAKPGQPPAKAPVASEVPKPAVAPGTPLATRPPLVPQATKSSPPQAIKSPAASPPVTQKVVAKSKAVGDEPEATSTGAAVGAKRKAPPPPSAPSKSAASKSAAPAAGALRKAPSQTAPSTVAPTANAPPTEAVADSNDPSVLYNFIGELGQKPIVVDGQVQEERLREVLKRLWGGVAKKPKDWIAVWQAMGIPNDGQTEVLQSFLNMAFLQTVDAEKAPLIVAELVKSHKVRLRCVEEVLTAFGRNLDGILAMNEDAWHVYSHFLFHVYPKPQGTGWGWSRVGWSWASWWKFVEQCTDTLDACRAFDVVALMLRLVQDREGQTLPEMKVWQGPDRLTMIIERLTELCMCDREEVMRKLGEAGVEVKGLA